MARLQDSLQAQHDLVLHHCTRGCRLANTVSSSIISIIVVLVYMRACMCMCIMHGSSGQRHSSALNRVKYRGSHSFPAHPINQIAGLQACRGVQPGRPVAGQGICRFAIIAAASYCRYQAKSRDRTARDKHTITPVTLVSLNFSTAQDRPRRIGLSQIHRQGG